MRVVSIVGARPQFVKAAAVSKELRTAATEILVHTGQHYDAGMSKVFFDELGIPEPDLNLAVGSGPHGRQTGRMLERIEEVLLVERPDRVLVYGDTNSTLAGALAAAKLQIPVAHVEAGLRSFRRDMPEEVNRVVTDHLSDLLFCPTQTAVDHLGAEGVTEGVMLVGDVMVDAIELVRDRIDVGRLRRLHVDGPYLLATLHRAENVDDAQRLEKALGVLGAMPERVVIPVHPRTTAAMQRHGLTWPANVTPLAPVGYIDMLTLVSAADAVLTDSGGLQKESVLLGTPCITLRKETEWVETVDAGMNRVVDLDAQAACTALEELRGARNAEMGRIFPAGASRRIVEALQGRSPVGEPR